MMIEDDPDNILVSSSVANLKKPGGAVPREPLDVDLQKPMNMTLKVPIIVGIGHLVVPFLHSFLKDPTQIDDWLQRVVKDKVVEVERRHWTAELRHSLPKILVTMLPSMQHHQIAWVVNP